MSDAVRTSGPLIQLGSNECALGPSPLVADALVGVASTAQRYPRDAALELRTRIATSHDVAADQIIVTNGSAEALLALSSILLQPGDGLVVAQPTFYLHIFMTERAGGRLTLVETVDGKQDLDGMLAAVDHQTKIVVLTNPHSPTGTYIDSESLRKFAHSLPDHVTLIVDEAYAEYADATDFASAISLVRDGLPVVVTRTFSKAFGLAGMRIGYAIGGTSLIARISQFFPPFLVNSASIAAACAAWDDREHLREVVQVNAVERDRLRRAFVDLGLTAYESQSNFVLIVGLDDAEGLADQLLQRRIVVRPTGDEFKGAGGLRVTTGTAAEDELLLDAMRELLR